MSEIVNGLANGVFITGTDTGVGKTQIAEALLTSLCKSGLRAVGYKPVAAGAIQGSEGWQNDDAQRLRAASYQRLPYAAVNPQLFAPAIAPHIAAAELGREIGLEPLLASYAALARGHQLVVVEGAGGWLVPLNATQTMADLAVAIGQPVVLVVGLRLGCINHALLSAAAIQASGAKIMGWVANHLMADMARAEENIAAIEARIKAPLLGEVAYLPLQSSAQFSASSAIQNLSEALLEHLQR